MENASKALIMAGSVLIAIMIIGALLLMFNNLSSYQNANIQNEKDNQTVAFNNQFATYNRNNVRGSELYSLLNRVVDYNRRKSTEGTGSTDEGQYIAYEPMEITFTLSSLNEFYPTTNNYEHLIIDTAYTVDSTTNDFDKIYKKIKKLEDDYGADTLNNLVIAFNSIFDTIDENKAVANFNNASKNKDILISSYSELEEHYQNICQYYEYVQFKRAKFNCTGAEYSQKTGRIIKMHFEFTGKFQ